MKRTLVFMACVLASLTMSAQDDLTVEDIQNSGCLRMARGEESEPLPTIVLTKEGSVLSVQLLNYESVCGTSDFKVTPTVNDGKDGDPLSISINVVPCLAGDDFEDCLCPYNLSFMVHDVEDNSFYLSCWWYKGMVELTEGEPMVLEYKVEDVTIDGMSFRLLKVMHKAMLKDWTTVEKELLIPSEVNYDGEVYTVMAVSKDAFWHLDQATKVTVPKTVRSMDLDYDNAIWANPFRECKSLEWIEVEDGCPLFSSVEGVLFSKDKTMLLGYPIASPRETYTVPEGVTNIRSGAFHYNMCLQKLVIPEEVTYLGWHLFNDMKSLKELYIRGVIEPGCMSDLFDGMNTKAAVYVQPSEVEKYQAVYKGPVYPLPEQTFDDKIEINEQNFPDKVFRDYVLSTAIDMNQNKVLDDDEILRVKEIDVHYKKIASLKGIEHFKELHKLTCYQNDLTELDLSSCTKLDTLNCAVNKLMALNLSNCSKLKWIRCDQNQLTDLDVSACTELKFFICSSNKITMLDISACRKLDDFECHMNPENPSWAFMRAILSVGCSHRLSP